MTNDEMDRAAEDAKQELAGYGPDPTSGELLSWYLRWYEKAGHKRLGRILVTLAKSLTATK